MFPCSLSHTVALAYGRTVDVRAVMCSLPFFFWQCPALNKKNFPSLFIHSTEQQQPAAKRYQTAGKIQHALQNIDGEIEKSLRAAFALQYNTTEKKEYQTTEKHVCISQACDG